MGTMMMMMIDARAPLVSSGTFYNMSSLPAVQHMCTSTDLLLSFFSHKVNDPNRPYGLHLGLL